MKKILLLIGVISFVSLMGKGPTLTEGLWYWSILEKDGTIRAADAAYRFKPDGSAELIYSERAVRQEAEMRAEFKKRTGKELPRAKLTFTWSVKNNRLHINMFATMDAVTKKSETIMVIGDDEGIMFPENKQVFVVLARKGAKLSPVRAKQFLKEVGEANRDRFADNLKLPENVELAEPGGYRHPGERPHWKDAPANSFQQIVVSAINRGKKLADNAKCDIPSLRKLLATEGNKALLLQYLACNAQWRLYPENDGSLHAVRYFCDPEGQIVPSLHQYYSYFLSRGADGKPEENSALMFQFRFDIGFGGKAWNRSIMYPREKTMRSGNRWSSRFMCGTALVDIFDESLFPGRQMTEAALTYVENEFAALEKNPRNWRELLPPGSVRKGKADLVLRNSIQGGIYEALLWCNPGEKGIVYLKAFEITKGTQLSAARLKRATGNVSGWSGDPEEQFCTGMYFTIYEGEWNQFYGARFEVWFKPENGGAERKLFEKNYRIQGWQR